ncbi:MAG: DMT family transporter [Immundisolibacteraceae bacterium]|nr:DMT family transporter [Immundisolibacteraceae bacterium]
MVSARLKAHLALTSACFFWAGNMVVARMMSDYLGGWHVVAVRCSASALLFLVLLRIIEPDQRLKWQPLGIGLFMALTGVVGYQGLLYFGVRMTSVINTSLIHATAPLVTMVMAAIYLRSPIKRSQLIAGLISLAGVVVIVSQGNWQLLAAAELARGDILIMLATVSFAAYSVVGRKVMSQRSVLELTTMITIWAAVIAMPMAGWEAQSVPARWGWQAIAGMTYITIFPGVLAMLAWNFAVKVVGPAESMLYMNTVPVIAVLMSVSLLGEQLLPSHLVGGGMVLAGCFGSVLLTQIAMRPANR